MLDKSYLPPAQARSLLLEALEAFVPPTEECGLGDAYGRVLAEDIVSPEDLPGFARSTVDGYAVNAADTFGARETAPAYLTVSSEVIMGAPAELAVNRGEAARIPTGGMLPPGTDAVVMLEHVQALSPDMLEVMKSVAPKENVIDRNEDVAAGETILLRGHRLRPQDVAALAGLGIARVTVFRRPVVAIISTGDEIVPPDRPLTSGQVRDINSYTLWGLITGCGGAPLKKGIFQDDYFVIRQAVEASLQESQMVLITGGTSAGAKDMTSGIINDLGEPGVLFHGVALKPGKPMIGGILSGKPVLGLPGHPAAVAVCFDLFIRPLIARLSGRDPDRDGDRTVRARMAKSVASAAGREDHIRVALDERGATPRAVPVLGKSGLITTLVKADGVVVIPAAKLGLDEGEEVAVRLF
jgi:molybdopterin molybdotransferase